jgi:hypothetical protein
LKGKDAKNIGGGLNKNNERYKLHLLEILIINTCKKRSRRSTLHWQPTLIPFCELTLRFHAERVMMSINVGLDFKFHYHLSCWLSFVVTDCTAYFRRLEQYMFFKEITHEVRKLKNETGTMIYRGG